ncbi:hypothetical protein B0H34DRAFT_840848 [Crassisporium funariophilum]|nr:hypothetical protein B0H34DRAFT_840848 [Crassisporium funariophilum]
MPRTRNVTRAQWDAANASQAPTAGTQNRNENGNESEKENERSNAGQATPSQTRTRSRDGILASTTTATTMGISTTSKGPENNISVKKTKLKSKGKAGAGAPKRKKLPLQDITSQFLPAPEAANRGESPDQTLAHAADSGITPFLSIQLRSNTGAVIVDDRSAVPVYSPLPPSSPPTPLSSPPLHMRKLPAAHPTWTEHPLSSTRPHHSDDYDPWQEFDNARPVSRDSHETFSTNSDPFGFVALERKLKVEREIAPATEDHEQNLEDDDADEHGRILVADTSSPRPVRRLKRPLYEEADLYHEDRSNATDRAVPHLPAILEHPHLSTPPTPHKDKQKKRRLSHEGHDVFSPCSSSIPSTPSPSKASARKRTRPAEKEDALDEFNEELERSQEVVLSTGSARKRSRPSQIEQEPLEAPSENKRTLRARAPKQQLGEEEKPISKRSKRADKGKSVKKPNRKAPLTAVKKPKKNMKDDRNGNDEEDLDEKWERERLERTEYFKRLEGYQVEKEDVYVI